MLRPLLCAAAVLLASTTLARAQYSSPLGNSYDYGGGYSLGFPSDYDQVRSLEQRQQDAAIEAKYRETVRNRIPDRKPSKDPWGNIRTGLTEDRHRPQ